MPDITGDQPGAACAECAKILQRIFKVGKPGMQGLLNNGIIHRNHTDQLFEGAQHLLGLRARVLLSQQIEQIGKGK
jgi:hypothetical protein